MSEQIEMTDRRFVSRRAFLVNMGFVLSGLSAADVLAKEVIKDVADLKPGEFIWHAHRQLEGPVAVVVFLLEQLVHVYRNGVRIAVSTCSSGKPGHETPTGVFVILERTSTTIRAPMTMHPCPT